MPATRTRAFLSDTPVIPGNVVRVLVGGGATYARMLEVMAAAQRTLHLETYIFEGDRTGQRFVDVLAERARAGVQVRVLVDGVGCLGTPRAFFAPITEAGGEVVWYRPVSNWSKSLYVRNHRKIVVVDDHTAFIGGLNLGDAYAPADWGGEAWHDVHAEVRGPAAGALARITARTWKRLTKRGYEPTAAPWAGDTPIQILESRPVGVPMRAVRRAYVHAIERATRRVCITNAYFVPDRRVRAALYQATKRGVRVELLLAGKSDVRAVQFASRFLYKDLMRHDVVVYEWDAQVLHAKTAVIDGAWCSIGSFNFDHRSLRHNLEANIACVDDEVGQVLEEQFDRDIALARRVDPRTWHRRAPLQKVLEALFYQVRYLL